MNRQSTSVDGILVGVDGSEGSAAALRWTTRLARASGPLGLSHAVRNEADWRDVVEDELEGTWCAPLNGTGVHHRIRVEEGRPGPRLAELAQGSVSARRPRSSPVAAGPSSRAHWARRPWPPGRPGANVDPTRERRHSRVDNPAGYLHLGFIVISLPNLALIAAMIALFGIALLAPFPREGGRGGGAE